MHTLLKMTKHLVRAKSAKGRSTPYTSDSVTSDDTCGKNASSPMPNPDDVLYLRHMQEYGTAHVRTHTARRCSQKRHTALVLLPQVEVIKVDGKVVTVVGARKVVQVRLVQELKAVQVVEERDGQHKDAATDEPKEHAVAVQKRKQPARKRRRLEVLRHRIARVVVAIEELEWHTKCEVRMNGVQ